MSFGHAFHPSTQTQGEELWEAAFFEELASLTAENRERRAHQPCVQTSRDDFGSCHESVQGPAQHQSGKWQ